jgi:hypothetical protein
MYQSVKLDMMNINFSGNEHIETSILDRPCMQLDRRKYSSEYQTQLREVYEFFIDPQVLLILEFIIILQELGIYHLLDAMSYIDLYEYSLFHPNAMVCTGCRSINFMYMKETNFTNGFVMCLNEQCKHGFKQRSINEDAVITLPLHGFNYNTYKQFCT